MKKAIYIASLVFAVVNLNAQTESFDIANFTPPAGWKRDLKKDEVDFTWVDKTKNTYCIIAVYSGVASKGNLLSDFTDEWNQLVIKPFGAQANPKTDTATFKDGRKIVMGVSQFNNQGSQNNVILTSYSGYGRVMSVVALMNSNEYKANLKSFLEGLSFNSSSNPGPGVKTTSGNKTNQSGSSKT